MRARLHKAKFVLPNLFTLASLFCGFYSVAQSFGAPETGETGQLYTAALAILFCESMYWSHRAASAPNAPVRVPPEYATITVRP